MSVLTEHGLEEREAAVEDGRFSFTGPTDLTTEQEQFVVDSLSRFRGAVGEFSTGAAHGVDTVVADELFGAAPNAKHRIVVPAAPHNESIVERGQVLKLIGLNFEAVRLRATRDVSTSDRYRARNELMVDFSETLIAYVWKSEFYRSGEWMTANIAWRAGVDVEMLVLPR